MDLMENIPIDPVGMKVSLVLGHLPALGRVSKPISQKFHFKKGKIYRFTVKITVIYGHLRHFNGLSIAAKQALYSPLFSAMLRGTATLVAIDTTRLKLQLWVFVQQFEKFKSISTTTKRGKTAKNMAFMFVNSQLHKLTFQRRSAHFGFHLSVSGRKTR